MLKSRWIAIVVTAVLAGGAASAVLAGEGREERGGRAGSLRGRFGPRLRGRVKHARENAPRFLASLDVTDDQRRLVLDKARAAAPIVAAAKDEKRHLIARSWVAASKDPAADRAALRASVKIELKALRERTRTQLEPLAAEVVRSLTPEQRKTIEENAGKKGRTVDDAKLTKFATRMISRPMTSAFLEERLGR